MNKSNEEPAPIRRSFGSILANMGLGSPALNLHRTEFDRYLNTLQFGPKPKFKYTDPLNSLKARNKWNKDGKLAKPRKADAMERYDKNIKMMLHDLKSWQSKSKVAARLYDKTISQWLADGYTVSLYSP